VSKTKSVGLRGQEVWVYDASLSLALAEVILGVEAIPEADRPLWWPVTVRELRVQAVIGDFYFDQDLALSDAQRDEFAQLLEAAADRLRRRGVFTMQEASAWLVLDDLAVIFRGEEPENTAPAAELAEALASLIRGTLPAAPPNTWWFYGSADDRRTIRMRFNDQEETGVVGRDPMTN
jgi:hypothetical protein